jgi:hypothetical protein
LTRTGRADRATRVRSWEESGRSHLTVEATLLTPTGHPSSQTAASNLLPSLELIVTRSGHVSAVTVARNSRRVTELNLGDDALHLFGQDTYDF